MLPFAFLFVSPLTALAVAAGAAAVPVIIHLLSRRRFRVVTWAAMRFLLAAQKQNARRLRLEQLILLAVRVLALLLLVLAMASVMPWAEAGWQWLVPADAAWVGTGRPRTHKILVLDGCYTMAAKAGDARGFDQARNLARRIVQESPAGDGFSVVLMSSPPRALVADPAVEPGRVADLLQGLRLPHGSADLAAGVSAVQNLLAASPDQFAEKEVYFFSNLQQATWLSASPARLAEALKQVQARARVVLVDVGKDGLSNTAVTGLSLGVPLATTAGPVPVLATVEHHGPDARPEARVELLVGRARAAADDPPLQMHVARQDSVRLNRGQTPVTFTYPFTRPGDYVVQVRVEGDALEPDDVRTAVVTVKDAVPVLLVNGKQAPDPFDQAAEWLRLALNPFDDGRAPSGLPARPKVLSEAQFATGGAADLERSDCVFLCDVARFGADEVRRLEAHVRRGGGAVFFLGGRADLGSYNDLLHKDGNGLLPAKLEARQSARADSVFQLQPEYRATQHPLLRAFAGDDDRNSLTAARFRQYVRAVPAAAAAPGKVLSFREVSTRPGAAERDARAGDPALIEWQPPAPRSRDDKPAAEGGPRARGRVVLVTTTANMDWNSWPASPSYLPMMQELFYFAVSGRLREQAVTSGEPLEEYLTDPAAGVVVRVRTPGNAEGTVRTLAHDDASVFRWTSADAAKTPGGGEVYQGTDASGLYVAALGSHPQEHPFAVNVPTAAPAQQGNLADLGRVTREDLSRAYPGFDVQLVKDLADVDHTAGVSGAGTVRARAPVGPAIAGPLLLTVLLLFLAEVVLAWAFGHYNKALGTPGTPAAGRLLPGLAAVFAAAAFLVFGVGLVHAAWTGDFLGFLPDAARRGAEQALGIPAPASGEGSRWRLEGRSFFWDESADRWVAGALALGAAALVVVVYTREGRTASGPYRTVLGWLRVGVCLLTVFVLLPQLQVRFDRQSWPDVVLMIDDSESMGRFDRYRSDPNVQAAADQLAQLAALTEPERLQLAQALVTRSQPDWLTALLTNHKVKVHVYRCSTRAERLASLTEPGQVGDAILAVNRLKADARHDASRLAAGVRQVLGEFQASPPAAVILLTDGVSTEMPSGGDAAVEPLMEAARQARAEGVPLFFVGLGDAHGARDLALSDLDVVDAVYVRDRLVFKANLTGKGYGDKAVKVKLYEKGKDAALREKTVPLNAQGKPVEVEIVHQPEEPGEKVFVLEVAAEDDEENKNNNRLERAVLVQEVKLIKVLFVEGEPRYEYRFLKTLLERESAKTKGNKTIDLKVLLTDADPDYATQDKSALAEFPSRAELNQFDVVILGDVNPRATPKMPEHLKDVADFVRERGGGLLMIAGKWYAPHAYKDTPLRDVLPIDVTADRQPDDPPEGRPVGYRPELTPEGRRHAIFRFDTSERTNAEVWNKLQPMFWWAEGYRPKRAAFVLAAHPRLKAAGKEGEAAEGLPLAVDQFVGAGRSMFFGFDETWRWRWREDELRFNQFWVQTVRYLGRSRLERTRLRLDRQTPYRRGEPIKVTVSFPGDAPPPGPDAAVKVTYQRRPLRGPGEPDRGAAPAETQSLTLSKAPGSRATFEALVTRTREGEYQFWLSDPAVPGSPPRAECRVLPPPGELERLEMNEAGMRAAAAESGGAFYTLADAGQLLENLPPGRRVTLHAAGEPLRLWNHPLLFATALVCLTLEWVLRKRKHLL